MECVQALLAARAAVNSRDEDGMQPIHFAASAGELEVVQALIGARASPDSRDDDEHTAMDHLPEGVRNVPRDMRRWRAVLALAPGRGGDRPPAPPVPKQQP